jgi:hypothetical protein
MKTIQKYIKFLLLTFILCSVANGLSAQKETEVFIPIGESPGVSHKYSVIGRVEKINAGDSSITLKGDSGIQNVRVTPCREFYLDQSKLKLTNRRCSFSEIKPGCLVEIKYRDNKPGNLIEWVKVRRE